MVCYLETKSADPYFDLAFEEYVRTHRTEGEHLLLRQNDNTVEEVLRQFLPPEFSTSLQPRGGPICSKGDEE